MLITSVKDNEIETQMKEKRKTKTKKNKGEATAKGWEINDFVDRLSYVFLGLGLFNF